MTVGTHTITATYNGATGVATSTDSLDQAVINAETATSLTSSVNPSVFGEAVTFTATVTITTGPEDRRPRDRDGHVHRRTAGEPSHRHPRRLGRSNLDDVDR